MKQTAVEWISQELTKIDIRSLGDYLTLIEQAKAMEKEQISEAYRKGVEEDVYNNPLKTGEQYYNETYKK